MTGTHLVTMRKIFVGAVLLLIVLLPPQTGFGASYDVQKVAEGVYAAIALPQGKAVSNAMILVTGYEVMLAGAHFVPEGIKELLAEIAKITPLPLRHVILTHHHRGFNYIDFDLPANAQIITSAQAFQSLKSELREIRNQLFYFDSNLTIYKDNYSIVLGSTEQAHSEGDLFVYLPKEGVLFTSDLLFNDVVGYMGDGSMRDWILSLEMLEKIGAKTVIPGVGQITDNGSIHRFITFFKEFMTEVLRNVEKGNNLAQTKKEFSLPHYRNLLN